MVQVFFKNQNLSAGSLYRFGALSKLRYMELDGCKFNIDAVKSLRKEKPGLTIRPVAKAFMGVRGPTRFGADLASECTITEVVSDSGAERAGLKIDDVITHVNNQEIQSFDDLILHISQFDVGAQPIIRVRRGEEEIDLPTILTGPLLQ